MSILPNVINRNAKRVETIKHYKIYRYPWCEMNVGDYFLIPIRTTVKSAMGIVWKRMKDKPGVARYRTFHEEGYLWVIRVK